MGDEFSVDEVLQESLEAEVWETDVGEFEGHYQYEDEYEDDEWEWEGAAEYEGFGAGVGPVAILAPAEEEALAYELMEITTEAELEEFLGKLFKKARKGVRKLGRRVVPKIGRFLKGPARQLVAKALPMVGSAVGSVVPGVGTTIGGMAGGVLGNMIGGGRGAPGGMPGLGGIPGLGGMSGLGGVPGLGGMPGLGGLGGLLGGGNPLAALMGGGSLGPLLGSLLGGEMEGASADEAQLEVSKRLVRTLSQSVAGASAHPAALTDPRRAAKAAFSQATRQHLPRGIRAVLASTPRTSGRWVRRGNNIVILGA